MRRILLKISVDNGGSCRLCNGQLRIGRCQPARGASIRTHVGDRAPLDAHRCPTGAPGRRHQSRRAIRPATFTDVRAPITTIVALRRGGAGTAQVRRQGQRWCISQARCEGQRRQVI